MASDLTIFRSTGLTGYYSLPSYPDDRKHQLSALSAATYTYGSDASEGLYLFAKSYSTSSTQSLSLDSGAIDDPFGDPLSFTAIKEIWIANDSTTDVLTVSGLFLDAQYGVSGVGALIAPGEVYHRGRSVGSGFTVTNGVSDTLVMDPGGATIAWRVVLLGV